MPGSYYRRVRMSKPDGRYCATTTRIKKSLMAGTESTKKTLVTVFFVDILSRDAFTRLDSILIPLAAGQGLEPQYHAPEACVLPLDEPAILFHLHSHYCAQYSLSLRSVASTR